MSTFGTDNRSPLARALPAGISFTVVSPEKGRLVGVRFALRSLPHVQIGGKGGAALSAVKYLTDECGWKDEQLFTELGEAVHDVETQAQVLVRALVVPPPEGAVLTAANATPMAKDADDLRSLLEPDEIAWLYREFLRFQHERSPLTRAKTPEEIEAFVDSLGKGTTPPSRLRSCDDAMLLASAEWMAWQLVTLTRRNSSPASPSSAPSDGSVSSSTSDLSGVSETPPTGPTIEILPSP